MSNSSVLWDKASLIEAITTHHHAFLNTIAELPEEAFTYSWNGKWTPAQQLVHITKSVQPVRFAFALPSFLLRFSFGKTNRPTASYDAVVQKYQKALTKVTRAAPKQFQPKSISYSQKEQVCFSYNKEVQRLKKVLAQFDENALDTYVLPHPLVGKLTLREMVFFTIYHVQHHHRITKEILENVPLVE